MDFILIFSLKKIIKKFFVFSFGCSLFVIYYHSSLWALENKITNDIGMEFILVQPGSFIMGSPKTEPFRDNDETQHKVNIIKPFYLQTTEVTIKQWRAVMGKKMFGRKMGGQNFPVTRVSFYDCQKFIKKLNKKNKGIYRLPLEAEWEYACRAGTTTAYFWGNDIDCSKAMYGNNNKSNSECTLFYESMGLKVNKPAPVKSFNPNPWGFYDMHGNVWEWCLDEYGPYKNTSIDSGYGTIKQEARIRRGGSWYKYSKSLRSANRTYAHPGVKFQTTGFRLVLETD